MQGVDILGTENVCTFMRNAKKSKFTIYRAGSNQANIPVFECLEFNTFNNAVQEFEAWANVINNSQVYKMILFNDLEESETGGIKKTKAKHGKNEIYFIINPAGASVQDPAQISGASRFRPEFRAPSMEEIKAEVIRDLAAQQEKSATLKALETITARLEALEVANNELEDEDEDEGGLFGPNSQLGNLLKLAPLLLNKNARTEAAAAAQKNPILNGNEMEVEQQTETREQKVEILNAAIKRLYKSCPTLHHDLTILANLSEKDPETFKFLINQLRNFEKQ